jgi:hypothetical protein
LLSRLARQLSIYRDCALGLGEIRRERVDTLAELGVVLVSARENMEHETALVGANLIARGHAIGISKTEGRHTLENSVQQIDITPARLAVRSLCRAANALGQVAADPEIWFFIILDLNRALYAALVGALDASSLEGAYDPGLRMQWLKFWENTRSDPNAQPPTSNRVPFLNELLTMAQTEQLIHLTEVQQHDLETLKTYRGNLEHIKPDIWFLRTTDLPRIVKNVAMVFEPLLERFQHRLEEDEVERTKFVVDSLKAAVG